MANSVSHLGSNPNVGIDSTATREQSCCCKLIETIKIVFQKIVDFLILIWYGIQHAFNYLITIDCCTRRRVFKDEIVCSTTNHATLSDLPKYVEAKRNPLPVSPKALNRASKMGFTSKVTTLKPSPYAGGHCFGNVACFLKTWLETKDVEKLKAEFKEGSPFMGAVYQEAYLTMHQSIYYPEVAEWIDTFLKSYPIVSIAEEKDKWLKSDFKNAVVIVDALHAYLKEGKHPSKDELTEYISNWVRIYKRKNVSGKYLATLRYVAEKYQNHEQSEKARMRSAFSHAGLQVEKFYYVNSTPTAVLSSLESLTPGAYKLSIPMYSSFGEQEGSHAIGLAIDPSGTCYILDSNLAIGTCTKEELTATIGRLFTEYTGFDYSKDLKGEPPTRARQVGNFFQERANPPSSPVTSGCDLIKVR